MAVVAKLCYLCGKALLGNYAHIADISTQVEGAAHISADMCFACLPNENQLSCDGDCDSCDPTLSSEDDTWSDEDPWDDDEYPWDDDKDDDDSWGNEDTTEYPADDLSDENCHGRHCGDCLLSKTPSCIKY